MKKVKLTSKDLVINSKIELKADNNKETSDTVKVSILARTNEPFFHYGFGCDVINDFSTMKHKSEIPFDWNHDEIVGKATGFHVGEEGLTLSGHVDKTLEYGEKVAQYLSRGIPLEASIAFRDFDCTKDCYIKPGDNVVVNGKTFTAGKYGLFIFKNYRLTSTAICKEGYDPHTNSKLVDDSVELTFDFKFGKEDVMEDIKNIKEDTSEVVLTPEEEAKEESLTRSSEEASIEGEIQLNTKEVEVEEVKEVEDTDVQLSKKEIEKFVSMFGAEKGLKFVLDGVKFEDAIIEAYTALKAEKAEKVSIDNETHQVISTFCAEEDEGVEQDITKMELKDIKDLKVRRKEYWRRSGQAI